MKKSQWGIIGLGNIAHDFVKDLQLLDNANIGAVASRTLSKAEDFAKKYGIEKAYGSYAELFADPDIDIVYIATPHDSHAEWSIKAMNAKKHVLCEKPLAINELQVQNMIDTAKKNGVFLMEAFWSRFNPSIRAVYDLVQKGEIGEVNYLQSDFCFSINLNPDNRALNMDLAGGSLLDIGVYSCFLPYLIFGNPQQILATGRFHETGADLQTAAIFKYANGLASMVSGFISESDMVAKIYGTEGRIFIDKLWYETNGFTIIRGNNDAAISEKISLPTQGKGFTYEIKECINCIENNQLESTHWSHQNSLDLIKIVDEIRRQIGLKYPFE